MKRLWFWTLFVAGMALAAWLPAKSVFPQLSAQILQLLATAGAWPMPVEVLNRLLS